MMLFHVGIQKTKNENNARPASQIDKGKVGCSLCEGRRMLREEKKSGFRDHGRVEKVIQLIIVWGKERLHWDMTDILSAHRGTRLRCIYWAGSGSVIFTEVSDHS